MLMVGSMVLNNSAKMLEMGVFFMFMHHYMLREAPIESKTISLDQDIPYSLFWPSHGAPSCQEKDGVLLGVLVRRRTL